MESILPSSAPNKTGSNHFCYLNKFSIVLMAIVGPDYTFICVDIGGYGKSSDGGFLIPLIWTKDLKQA